MFIVADYELRDKIQNVFFVESREPIPPCPICSSDSLRYRDRRRRICKTEGGAIKQLMIRRFRCSKCRTYHNELPDCLTPYKQYATEVISGVLDGVVSSEDADTEDYPSHETMRRWRIWFQQNMASAEGHLRRIGEQILNLKQELLFAPESLLSAIRTQFQDWLERILRMIYNSGGRLRPIRW